MLTASKQDYNNKRIYLACDFILFKILGLVKEVEKPVVIIVDVEIVDEELEDACVGLHSLGLF